MSTSRRIFTILPPGAVHSESRDNLLEAGSFSGPDDVLKEVRV